VRHPFPFESDHLAALGAGADGHVSRSV
jgi:hypothetical protein